MVRIYQIPYAKVIGNTTHYTAYTQNNKQQVGDKLESNRYGCRKKGKRKWQKKIRRKKNGVEAQSKN